MDIRLIELNDGAKDERRDGRMQIQREMATRIQMIMICYCLLFTGNILDACNTCERPVVNNGKTYV